VYRVLATTNPGDAMTAWTVISTNVFDIYGNFHSTNPTSPGARQEFFRVLLGGTLPPPPVAPFITSPPADRAVKTGETAKFSVSAGGTAPLRYQWFFNTNIVLADETNTTLVIPNAQTNDTGGYSVRVTNSVGSVTSVVAWLTVLPPAPPSVATQPADLTVSEGATAVFGVGAEGYGPLSYQWFFNGTNLLANATNAAVAVTNVQPADAGGFSVRITNTLGSVTSRVAVLTVTAPGGAPDFSLYGHAALNGGTTGGAGGTTVTVTNKADFQNAVNQAGPMIVQVDGSIDLATTLISGKADKTIIGLGTNATLLGDLQFQRCTNVIVRNVQSINPASDGMTIQDFCERIWVDHCTFGECGDGQIDITHGSDFITVSWCQFTYTNIANLHRFSSLVGHDDANGFEDEGRLHITYHHNVWGTLVRERMPRVRFGGVHVFNTYFHAPGNNYCTLSATNAQVLLENNYYQDIDEPWRKETTGRINATGCVLVNCTNTDVPVADPVATPPYSYWLEPAADVPGVVTTNAGAGKGPFAP
jgi:pectate lyase